MQSAVEHEAVRVVQPQGRILSLKRLIALVLKACLPGGRKRQSAADLPTSLRHDIGLGPNPDLPSFEDRWQAELRLLRK